MSARGSGCSGASEMANALEACHSASGSRIGAGDGAGRTAMYATAMARKKSAAPLRIEHLLPRREGDLRREALFIQRTAAPPHGPPPLAIGSQRANGVRQAVRVARLDGDAA